MGQKFVVVTGGTRGIGRAIVRRLLDDPEIGHVRYTGTGGVQVRDRSLVEMGFDASRHQGDALNLESTAGYGFVGHLPKRIHGLVLNAAVCATAPLGATDGPEVFERVLAVNLRGNYLLADELLPRIEDGGRIVAIASQLGVVGRAGYSAYCASKHGLIGMVKVWASELGGRGITVNAVCPGWIETEMTGADLARLAAEAGEDVDTYRRRITERLDLRRMNTPEEVAEIVAFLLSPRASGITGRTIEMAGPSG